MLLPIADACCCDWQHLSAARGLLQKQASSALHPQESPLCEPLLDTPGPTATTTPETPLFLLAANHRFRIHSTGTDTMMQKIFAGQVAPQITHACTKSINDKTSASLKNEHLDSWSCFSKSFSRAETFGNRLVVLFLPRGPFFGHIISYQTKEVLQPSNPQHCKPPKQQKTFHPQTKRTQNHLTGGLCWVPGFKTIFAVGLAAASFGGGRQTSRTTS